eukprot:11959077-Alexandrium_andersonii.AAC.1
MCIRDSRRGARLAQPRAVEAGCPVPSATLGRLQVRRRVCKLSDEACGTVGRAVQIALALSALASASLAYVVDGGAGGGSAALLL